MIILRQPFSTRWLDRLGAGVSFGCGLHCVALSLLLVVNPALWFRLARHGDMLRWLFWLEIGLAGLALLLGAVAFTLGWLRHRRMTPLLLAIPGLTALLLGVVSGLHDQRFIGSGPALSGGVLMILAHWQNTRACRFCIPAARH